MSYENHIPTHADVDRILTEEVGDDGLLTKRGEALLSATLETREEVALEVAHRIANLRLQCVAIKSAESALAGRRKAIEIKAGKASTQLGMLLEVGQCLDDGYVEIDWRESSRTVVDDEGLLPTKCWVKQDPKLSLTEVKKWLGDKTSKAAHIDKQLRLRVNGEA